jgi:glutaredoxin
MLTVTLFTKAGCGLCDEVKASLEALRSIYPHQLIEVDITQDRSLFAQYHYTIPVVQIGLVELTAPITAVQLQQALQNDVNG